MTKKNEYFKALCEVSRAFGTTIDEVELLDLIVKSAVKTLGGKAACVFLADKEKDLFSPMAQKGLSQNYLHSGPERAKKAVADVLKGGYLAIKDATTDPRVENHEAKKAEGIASILVVPIMVKKQTIGILSLYTASPRDFSKDEIALLMALAEQGGMAIERARLFDRVRENTRLFYNLAASINSTLDIKQILHTLTAEIASALQVKGSSIRLLDENHERLELVASHGLSEGFLEKGPISAQRSISQALEGKPVVIKNAATDKRIQYKKAMAKEGIISMLCVPIMAKEDVIGVLRLYSAAQREFTEEEITLVFALAHQGGLAIQNASLYMRLEQDIRDLKADLWSHRSWF